MLKKKTKANRAAVIIAHLDDRFQRFVFKLVVTETLNVFNSSVRALLIVTLAGSSSTFRAKSRQLNCLYQRISLLAHRFNAVLLHDGWLATNCPN